MDEQNDMKIFLTGVKLLLRVMEKNGLQLTGTYNAYDEIEKESLPDGKYGKLIKEIADKYK